MATSGSKNFSQVCNELILDAFQLIGVYGIGRTISAEDNSLARRLLNKMVKAWGAEGLHLWTKEEAVLFLNPSQASYSLGNASSDDKCCLLSDLVLTRLNGAHSASDTTLVVDSTTGMANSDYIGIVTTDKTIHWTTISNVTSSTGITIASGLDTAASDNALVYTFTNKIYKPLRILNARRRTGYDSGSTSDEVDVQVSMTSYEVYQNLPTKSHNGTVTQAQYTPKNTSGQLNLFQRPSDGNERLHFTYERIIDDLDSSNDDFDFPSEWLEPLTYQLAVRLGIAFGKSQKTMNVVLPVASKMLENLLAWDSEITSVTIVPDLTE